MAKGQTQHITWFYKKVFLGTAAAKSLQSCPTLCDPIDGSPPGSPIPGILQARTLEWVAISFSYAWKWKVQVKLLSHVRLLATTWTAAYQAPPSMGFSRQEYWSGVPLPSLFLGTVTAISVSSIASFFAWIIPWTEGPGKLQSMGSQRVRYDFFLLHITLCLLRSVISPCYGREGDRQLLYFSESITLLYVSSFLSSSNKHIPYRIRYTCVIF